MTELKESLPRSGHVNEVCKEWLVREDGALAYQLQSKEINEFYNGNRFRNGVVRQDFPTALHEQIKEKERAARQAEMHHMRLLEQEQADAELAKQIADKLEMERESERLREVSESELMAKMLQRTYIEKAKVKELTEYPPSSNILHKIPQHIQQHGDVANIRATRDIDLHEPKNHHPIQPPLKSPTHSLPFSAPSYENVNSASGKPLPPLPPPSRNALPPKRISPAFLGQNLSGPVPTITSSLANGKSSGQDSDNVADSIRQYNLNDSMQNDQNRSPSSSTSRSNNGHLKSHKLQLSPEKYDYIMQNLQMDSMNEIVFPEDVQTIDDSRQNITSNGMRSNKPALANIKNVTGIKDLGLPPEEVLELDKKLEQEKRDQELAVRLQKEEARESLTQEERDRLLAIEAQDKELAKMLQERERAKARRAKEKARLKKMQSRPQSDFEGHSYTQHSPNNTNQKTGRTSDIRLDGDSYSNPIDLIASGHSSLESSYRHERMSSSLSADHDHLTLKDDEIYTLPIEDDEKVSNRPNSLAVVDDSQKYNLRGNHSPDSFGNIAATIDPTYSGSNSGTHNSNMSSPIAGYNTNNAPPYMPIQGTRRSASLDVKKKKSKDKCAHQ